jgi:hypothetical protein
MNEALTEALRGGADAVVLVGSDCPGVDTHLLGRAFRALKRKELVLGPAADGGYYLVGIRRPAPELFAGIEWGRADVLDRTLAIARTLGLGCELLDVLSDVDRPRDLTRWHGCAELLADSLPSPRISAIVPALNEEKGIARTLSALSSGRNVEVILVDGGSTDRTRQIARSHGARVVEGPPRRARQANLGAEVARGKILFFLHADTLVPPGYDTHIRSALRARGVLAGAFDLAIDGKGVGLRFIERTVAFRSRWRQLPYGDQGLFLPAATFRRIGPFPDMPIMEDYVLVRKLARRGRIVTVPVPVLTSARRWHRLGVARTTLLNSAVVAAFRLGVAPERLAHWYRSGRNRAVPSEASQTVEQTNRASGGPNSRPSGRRS